ncbi:ATPase Cu transporting protein 7B [Dermatophagoides farinae]|uniref:ATPase Cu transporting protein 7B n=1 Tax=Dermatophagoides farinae TaxID=6954 RepID=A0A922HVB1_DERFA|nr:ATPase Cu transporting protein 7B [Dermatophagoides farinae]
MSPSVEPKERVYETIEDVKGDGSPCSAIREELKFCIRNTDCVKELRMTPKECLKTKHPSFLIQEHDSVAVKDIQMNIAFKSLRNGHLSMDVLITLATTIAYLYSVGVVVYFIITDQRQSPMTFFDTPPMLLVFISLGRWLEHMNRLQTTEYIVNLMSLRPVKATLLELDRNEQKPIMDGLKMGDELLVVKNERIIDIDLVEKGDYLRVRPGERIPTDGRMIGGEAMLDESFINGESMPVAKKSGSILLGGSIVSNGTVVMVATNVGADSQLCQIVKMVENAQTTKAPIQQLADRISSYFIPFVIITSLIVFFIWLWIGPKLYQLIYSLNPNFYAQMTATEVVIQFAFQIGLSVLIISCPCALGIATPSAVIIGTGIGAINGIHIKGAEPLERAQRLDTIIFDKTGTLTYGKPSVTNLKLTYRFTKQSFDSFARKLIIMIGMAEANSDHPIAVSVANFARSVLRMDTDASFGQLNSKFKLEAGLGIRCQIERNHLKSFESSLINSSNNSEISSPKWLAENFISYASYIDPANKTDQKFLLDEKFFDNVQSYKIIIGNMRWMKKNNIPVESEFQNENDRLEHQGETVFNVAINGKILCLISVADTVKPEALLAIYTLKNRFKLDVMLLTGDNVRSALAIGRKVGINHIYAELLPQHKMDKIKHLQSQGLKVAMVGDGINDAPALAQADLGIAIAKGTDITMESADVVLTKASVDDLLDIVSCIDLSTKTMRRIRINFLLAFIYNVVFIPIAAGIFIKFGMILQPWMSGACMAFSSISVSCSSLLLRRYRKPTRRQIETDDYHRYKSRVKLQNHGVTFPTISSSSPSSASIMDLDKLSIHNAHNLIDNGVTKVDHLYRPKSMVKIMSLSRQTSNESATSSDSSSNDNYENVRLIKMNKDDSNSNNNVQIMQSSATNRPTNAATDMNDPDSMV